MERNYKELIRSSIKYIIIVIIIIITVTIANNRLVFKLEKFKSIEEAQQFFEAKYPKNSDVRLLIHYLEKCGVTCRKPTKFELDKLPEGVIICEYTYGVLADVEWTWVVTQRNNYILKIAIFKTSTAL